MNHKRAYNILKSDPSAKIEAYRGTTTGMVAKYVQMGYIPEEAYFTNDESYAGDYVSHDPQFGSACMLRCNLPIASLGEVQQAFGVGGYQSDINNYHPIMIRQAIQGTDDKRTGNLLVNPTDPELKTYNPQEISDRVKRLFANFDIVRDRFIFNYFKDEYGWEKEEDVWDDLGHDPFGRAHIGYDTPEFILGERVPITVIKSISPLKSQWDESDPYLKTLDRWVHPNSVN